jgi:hypothetical protein
MAIGRRREEWERTASMLSLLAAANGVKMPIENLNPYRPAPRPLTPDQEADRAKEAIAAFTEGLRFMVRGR